MAHALGPWCRWFPCTWLQTAPPPAGTWSRTPHILAPAPVGLTYEGQTWCCLGWPKEHHWLFPERQNRRWQWNIGSYTTLPWTDLIITAKMEHIVLVIAHWLFWPQNAHLGRKRSTWNAISQAFGFVFLALFGGKSEISDTTIKDQHVFVVYRRNCSENTIIFFFKCDRLCIIIFILPNVTSTI